MRVRGSACARSQCNPLPGSTFKLPELPYTTAQTRKKLEIDALEAAFELEDESLKDP